jgi:serine/threonine-protein kinase
MQQQPAAMQAAAPAPSASAGGRTGILRINSRPWAQILVDGRLMGNTPQPNLQLSAGSHKVQLVNQPMGLSKTFSITVKAGEVVTKVMNLAE